MYKVIKGVPLGYCLNHGELSVYHILLPKTTIFVPKQISFLAITQTTMTASKLPRNERRKPCKPKHLERNQIEIKLLCQTCDLVLDLKEVRAHPHKENLRRLVIRHYLWKQCGGKFIVCTCKCGNELGHEPVSRWVQIPETSIVLCWPCGQIYHFSKKVFNEGNKEILHSHPVSSLSQNNPSIIKSFKLPKHI